MAEGILRQRAIDRGIDLEIDSSGTGDYHIGESPDHRAMTAMVKNGLDISDLRARQFSLRDFDLFDKIFVMDHSNYRNVLKLAKSEGDRSKVELFLNLAYPGENREVPDPYFGGDQGFQSVHDMLLAATDAFLDSIDGQEG